MTTFMLQQKNFRRVSLLLLVGIFISSFAFAGGDQFSPRIIGMGRTFTALSRGLDAVGANPANLALNDRDAAVTFNLFSVGAVAGSDFINYKIYKDNFTGIPDPNDPTKRIPKYLSDQDKNDILSLFPEGIAYTQTSVGAQPIGLSLQIGDLGFALVPSAYVASNIDLPEGYLKFPLMGNTVQRNYSFDGTAINASLLGEVNLSAGYLLPVYFPNVDEFAVGLGLKYLLGYAFAYTDHYKAHINAEGHEYINTQTGEVGFFNDQYTGEFDFLQFVAVDTVNKKPVGSGFGVDLGASAMLFNMVRVGISITDIGSIKWDKYTKAIYSKTQFSVTMDKAGQDTISKAFKGTTVDTTAFSYSLPTALHIGGEMRLDDVFRAIPFGWTVALDMHVGFNNVAGNTTLAQFALGTELDPLAGWLPLRTGIVIGGRERFAWAVGFGLHFANTFDLDFATQSFALITKPDSFRMASAVVGMRFRF